MKFILEVLWVLWVQNSDLSLFLVYGPGIKLAHVFIKDFILIYLHSPCPFSYISFEIDMVFI
jgi:hypothetical protein